MQHNIQLFSCKATNGSNRKGSFVIKCEGDSLVWNQYITKPKEKCGGMVYYIPTVWKSGGTRPPPNCDHGSNTEEQP